MALDQPGALQPILGNISATDSVPTFGSPSPLINLRFIANQTGRILWAYVDLQVGSGSVACTLQPIYRRAQSAVDNPAAENFQFLDTSQDWSLAAAGLYARSFTVPKGMEVGLFVKTLTGTSAAVYAWGATESAV